MDKFKTGIAENTIPLIFYILTSFVVIFITNLTSLGILFIMFLLATGILFEDKSIFKKIMLISLAVIILIILLSMLFSFEFNIHQAFVALPKSISFSIMVSSGIAFIFLLPTYQLVQVSKIILPNTGPIYALIAGFRVVPVFIRLSKKIFLSTKIRGINSAYVNIATIFSQNIIIEFLDFLSAFLNRISFLDVKNISVEYRITYKTIFVVSYFFLSITLMVYHYVS